MTTCTYFHDIGHPQGGRCNHPDIRKTVSFGVCQSCPMNDGGDKWLAFRRKHKIGSRIAKATTAIGIKPCGGCNRRKSYLDGDVDKPQ